MEHTHECCGCGKELKKHRFCGSACKMRYRRGNVTTGNEKEAAVTVPLQKEPTVDTKPEEEVVYSYDV
jgi:hypothetical protein